jgi:hypothetical protein
VGRQGCSGDGALYWTEIQQAVVSAAFVYHKQC